ncbi:MAG: hypothetical protein O2931_08765 [Planctomycetota bacterium]|nr:hypothetical protein [Planctomycetota bacterium]MDA1178873.1 hypothetical protein [Planctomycetota bacterium]
MARYAISFHKFSPGNDRKDHWDLFLEAQDGALWTWALSDAWGTATRFLGIRLPDHRPIYLDYDGAISGERGTVERIATGEYDIVQLGDDGLPREITLNMNTNQVAVSLQPTDEPHTWQFELRDA